MESPSASSVCEWSCARERFQNRLAWLSGISYDFLVRAAAICSQAESGNISRSLNSPAPRSHCAPSITTHSPLMYGERSLNRKAARLVNSSWRPKRFIGLFSRACSSYCFEGIRRDHAPSVGNGPGAMALMRMRYLAHSTASEVVIAKTPALAHAEGTTNADPPLAAP